ncbi:hypothetical protein WJX73_007138 [Symbiochloris irregularis]|uniref:Uncharacterized protein n=1 Tax=Symbiochloris irregularis TaxID=706552 RepID=A0AAW1PUX6_9CHLO
MQSQVQALYRAIIDDVIGRGKPEFQEAGLDEAVLDELRVLWEAKLSESGALDSQAFREEEAKQRAARQEVATAPRSIVFAPGSSAGRNATPAAVQAALAKRARIATAAVQHPQHPRPLGQPPAFLAGSVATISGRGAPQGLPPHLMQYANVLSSSPIRPMALPGVKRERDDEAVQQLHTAAPVMVNGHVRQHIPQQDGAGDSDEGSDDLDDEAAAKICDEADKEAVKEELDTLSDVDLDDEQVDNPTSWAGHKIVCHFDKVKRSKNKWTCSLRDGIMSIHGQDLYFKTATADLQF